MSVTPCITFSPSASQPLMPTQLMNNRLRATSVSHEPSQPSPLRRTFFAGAAQGLKESEGEEEEEEEKEEEGDMFTVEVVPPPPTADGEPQLGSEPIALASINTTALPPAGGEGKKPSPKKRPSELFLPAPPTPRSLLPIPLSPLTHTLAKSSTSIPLPTPPVPPQLGPQPTLSPSLLSAPFHAPLVSVDLTSPGFLAARYPLPQLSASFVGCLFSAGVGAFTPVSAGAGLASAFLDDLIELYFHTPLSALGELRDFKSLPASALSAPLARKDECYASLLSPTYFLRSPL